ncbi:DUF7285 family protein [Halobacterium rubrum]|uniref:DUF7285 family protein n=1 Tax=Halobacterium TaxID=2239 RepID=UPI001F19E8CA|nr:MULTISPECIES: hypothetical protein [Halobacterium]MDH5021679.1 hypothetical protein [Halobacterium rubrum]
MSRSSARRAQVEPVPAAVAVLALCLAIAAYGSVRAGVLPPADEGAAPAAQVLDDVDDAATPNGSLVVEPDRLSVGPVPAGYEATVRLEAGDRSWTAGATQPAAEASTASRPVPVRVESSAVRPGRLTVVVWQ